jgi:hypothetical protein
MNGAAQFGGGVVGSIRHSAINPPCGSPCPQGCSLIKGSVLEGAGERGDYFLGPTAHRRKF